jgi:hypothetical protein
MKACQICCGDGFKHAILLQASAHAAGAVAALAAAAAMVAVAAAATLGQTHCLLVHEVAVMAAITELLVSQCQPSRYAVALHWSSQLALPFCLYFPRLVSGYVKPASLTAALT